MPSEAWRCRTAKYRLRISERKVQKLQSCHYGLEEQIQLEISAIALSKTSGRVRTLPLKRGRPNERTAQV